MRIQSLVRQTGKSVIDSYSVTWASDTIECQSGSPKAGATALVDCRFNRSCMCQHGPDLPQHRLWLERAPIGAGWAIGYLLVRQCGNEMQLDILGQIAVSRLHSIQGFRIGAGSEGTLCLTN